MHKLIQELEDLAAQFEAKQAEAQLSDSQHSFCEGMKAGLRLAIKKLRERSVR